MNIKDRQIILHYLRNMVNSEYEPEDMDFFIRKLSKYSLDLFGFCLTEILDHSTKPVADKEKEVFIKNLLNGELCRTGLLTEDDFYEPILLGFETRMPDYKVDITSPDFDKNFTIYIQYKKYMKIMKGLKGIELLIKGKWWTFK